jgi:hypothetical protein
VRIILLVYMLTSVLIQVVKHHLDEFNHTQRSWIVIWELGVVVELPPWVLLAYPSSLLYHFNIDINGKLYILYRLINKFLHRYQICNNRG